MTDWFLLLLLPLSESKPFQDTSLIPGQPSEWQGPVLLINGRGAPAQFVGKVEQSLKIVAALCWLAQELTWLARPPSTFFLSSPPLEWEEDFPIGKDLQLLQDATLQRAMAIIFMTQVQHYMHAQTGITVSQTTRRSVRRVFFPCPVKR